MSGSDTTDTTDRPPEQPSSEPVGDPQPTGGQPAQPSLSTLASDATTKAYVKFITACFALVGVAAGLAVVLVGFLGGAPLSPDIIVSPSTFVNNFDAVMGQLYANRLAFQTMNAAPVVAGVLGVAGGFYVANTLDSSDRHTYVASALGGGIGAFVLVVVVGVLASLAISSVPTPEPSQTASSLGGMGAQTSQLSSASGAISAVYIGGTKLAFDKLAFNAVAVGAGVGLVSAASAYVVRELAPSN